MRVGIAGGGLLRMRVGIAGGGLHGMRVGIAGGGLLGMRVGIAGGGLLGMRVGIAGGGLLGTKVRSIPSSRGARRTRPTLILSSPRRGRIEGREAARKSPTYCMRGDPATHISLTARTAAGIQALPSARTRVRDVLTGKARRGDAAGLFPARGVGFAGSREPEKGGDARCLDAGSCNALRGTLLTPPEPFRPGASPSRAPRTRRPPSHATVLPQPFRALVAPGPEGPFPHRYGSPARPRVTNEKSPQEIFSGDFSVDKRLNYNEFWISRWTTGGQLTDQSSSSARRRPASFSPVSK